MTAEKWAAELQSTLTECFEQIRFARAAELARSKRYLEAEGLLAPNGRVPSDPKVLDLLARISAKQRRFDRARRFWEEALKEAPGNGDYQRAIERAKEAERSQELMWKAAVISLCAIAATFCVLVLWEWLSPFPSGKQPERSVQFATEPKQARSVSDQSESSSKPAVLPRAQESAAIPAPVRPKMTSSPEAEQARQPRGPSSSPPPDVSQDQPAKLQPQLTSATPSPESPQPEIPSAPQLSTPQSVAPQPESPTKSTQKQ